MATASIRFSNIEEVGGVLKVSVLGPLTLCFPFMGCDWICGVSTGVLTPTSLIFLLR